MFLEKNHLKQILAFMVLLLIVCVYLSLLQFELFACFLFLGEFTIGIFFYCLFLHLNADRDYKNNNKNTYQLLAFTTLIFVVTLYVFQNACSLKLFNANDLNLVWTDLYQRCNNFSLNDLGFVYYYFTSYNCVLFWLIAVLLCVLTLVILSSVYIYNTVKITKNEIFTNSLNKTAAKKNYFEQTPISTQKIIKKK